MAFWEREIETMGRPELERAQLEGLRETVRSALRTSFYRELLATVGIRCVDDIHSLDDLRRIPFTTKDDLRRAFPDGLLAVERAEVVRLHASSGTTGIPTVIYHTRADIDRWANLNARSLAATGCSRDDVFRT